ncbi:MAG TPA: tetratricopeptide repeat protein, partial [Bryobacteraceae bacterium]|nr:tetratricopeptide repeat protein [Bryobacteraceae bacterium]
DKRFGPGHLQSAVSMNNLASVLAGEGNFAEAEQLERKSIAIFAQKLPNSAELAAAYANLAGYLMAKNAPTEAVEWLRRAIMADEASGGAGTLQEAADLASLAQALRPSDASGSERALRRALSIYENRLGAASEQAQRVRNALAERQSGSKE